PANATVTTIEMAVEKAKEIGYPLVVRPSYVLGGRAMEIVYDEADLRRYFQTAVSCLLYTSPSPRDISGSRIPMSRGLGDVYKRQIVCSIENFDAMGIHTGDSITVAPAQTLTDKEYQIMRNASMAVLREIGVETGGSNVQFAVNPKNGRLIVIEMNPRVSRSSALASKATGFPIAKVAAKLAVGYTLDELMNDITGGRTPASFEPSIDYVVTKIPRFNFEKFAGANDRLTTQMKSVGEVMAIGRTQQESLQKALRGLEVGATGFDPKVSLDDPEALTKIRRELKDAGAERIWYIADAFRAGLSVDGVFNLTNIDRWFLVQIEELVRLEEKVAEVGITGLHAEFLRQLKRKGFADARLAKLAGVREAEIRKLRDQYDLHPVYKRVDTCAAEFATDTAYMYSTYEEECESNPSDRDKIMVLGGGPNRIGQGIEFDYCCVHASLALREDGYETIMVNCNPETVSTDYDTSDRLYFEPVTLEDVLEIVRIEKPKGVIVQYGGQTPLKLARALEAAGVPVIGTSPDAIDRAEDRERFQHAVERLKLKQ
ncbi:carbamoyl-phosphate synthase large subunit, partial [Escherichia coli]